MLWIFCYATFVLSSHEPFNRTKWEALVRNYSAWRPAVATDNWYRNWEPQNLSVDENHEKDVDNLFFSSVPENCPEPIDGLLLWERPEDEVYGEECMTKLKETKTNKVLLEAMRPAIMGYPTIRGFLHVTLDVPHFFSRNRNQTIFETQLQKLNKSKLLDHSSLVVRIGLL